MVKVSDGKVREACFRMQTKTERSTVLQCVVQLLYPLEFDCQPRSNSNQDNVSNTATAATLMDCTTGNDTSQEIMSHPERAVAVSAYKNVVAWMAD